MNHDPEFYGTPTDIHRTQSGGVDFEDYFREAHRQRTNFLREVISGIARLGWRVWGWIKEKMLAQRSAHTLSRMSSRELKDLGLTGNDIESVASGAYFTDPTRSDRARARRKSA